MYDFDWTTISADIAAAFDFLTDHGAEVYSIGADSSLGLRVSARGDVGTLTSIGGSWSLYTPTDHGVLVQQEIAGVILTIATDDPEVVDRYMDRIATKNVDWSTDND